MSRCWRSATQEAASGKTNVSLGVNDRQGGAARLRLRQRQALAGAAAERRCEGFQARDRHGRDACCSAFRRSGSEVARWPSMNSARLQRLRSLEESLGLEAIREALPAGTPVRARLAGGSRATPGSEIQQGADLVIVGCSSRTTRRSSVISSRDRAAGGPARRRPVPAGRRTVSSSGPSRPAPTT